MSLDDSSKKIQNIITTLNESIDTQLKNIDVEIEMYGEENNDFEMDITNLEHFIPMDKYDLNQSVNRDFIKFFDFVSYKINSDLGDGISDFDENTATKNPEIYHVYMILILKLLNIYSTDYIRKYISAILKLYEEAVANKRDSINLPFLILPQNRQTHSMYYLMNRYNSKAYNPDRALDFSHFLFNFMKPEFQPDTTKALNLFQPGIGKRYNSILIYSKEAMQSLSKLRDTLNTLAIE